MAPQTRPNTLMTIFIAMATSLKAKVFLDSAYVIALDQATDAHHDKALELAVSLREGKTLATTTRAVLLEIGNYLARGTARRRAEGLINSLESSRYVEVLSLSDELAFKGWTLFCQRHDKNWSWTDCISFIVMREPSLEQALTSDQHFEQASFTAMLR